MQYTAFPPTAPGRFERKHGEQAAAEYADLANDRRPKQEKLMSNNVHAVALFASNFVST